MLAGAVVVQGLFAATMLQAGRFDARFRRALDLPLLLLVAAGLSPVIGATLSTLSRYGVGNLARSELTFTWLRWWAGDVTRIMSFLPFLLLVGGRERRARELGGPGRSLERAGLVALALVLGGLYALRLQFLRDLQFLPEFTLALVPVMWAAIRFDLTSTAGIIAVISVSTMAAIRVNGWLGDSRVGPVGLGSLDLQARLVVAGISGLAVCQALTNERRMRARVTEMSEEVAVRARHLQMALRSGRSGTWEMSTRAGDTRWIDDVQWLPQDALPQSPRRFRSWLGLVRSDHRRWVLDSVRGLSAASPRFEIEVPVLLPDGSEGWHRARAEYLQLTEGPRVIGTLTDVTERHRAVQENERLAAIVASSTEAILTIDASGRIRRWNQAAARLFDLGEDKDRFLTYESVVPPELQERERTRIQQVFGGARFAAQRTERITLGGRVVPVQTSLFPVRDATEQVVEAAAICRDLTEQLALEGQLLQAQKLEVVGRLTGGVAHDFNNLLTVILGHTHLAIGETVAGEPVHRSLEHIRRASEQAASLTRRLLAFSRRGSGARVPIEIDRVVAGMESLLRGLIGDAVQLAVRCDARGAHVLADPQMLEQVLLNLVVNARDATPAGGEIEVETHLRAAGATPGPAHPGMATAHVELIVRDDGQGMDAETQAHIFEPFFTTQEPGHGTGLGLSTVLTIVEEIAGDVCVTSAPGLGTTFTLLLPITEARAADHPGAAAASARGGESIWVVEGDPQVRSFMAASLTQSGYDVQTYPGGEEALAALAGGRFPELALCDLLLADGSGARFADELRRMRAGARTILMSGLSAWDQNPVHGQVLVKPFTLAKLLDTVHEALDRPATTGPGSESQRSAR